MKWHLRFFLVHYTRNYCTLATDATEPKKTVKTVCTDMHDGFVNAATSVFGDKVVELNNGETIEV